MMWPNVYEQIKTPCTHQSVMLLSYEMCMFDLDNLNKLIKPWSK